MMFLPKISPHSAGWNQLRKARGLYRRVVLQAELVKQRKHSQPVDVIRREQHVDPARVLAVALDDQVLGEQLGVLYMTFQFELGVLGNQLTADGARGDDRLA